MFGPNSLLAQVRENTENNMRAFAQEATHSNPFSAWPRELIIETLVMYGIEIRYEHARDHQDLIDFASEVFAGQGMPEPAELPTEDELKAMEKAARLVQNNWFRRKGYNDMADNSDRASFQGMIYAAMLNNAESIYAAEMEDDIVDDGPYDEEAGAGVGAVEMTSVNESKQGEPQKAKKPHIPHLGTMGKRNPESILNKKFVPANVEIAEKLSAMRHPSRGHGDELEPFPIWKTSTGRHCVEGGCGEQLDLFREGAVSEYGKFGPGITLYFKFLKWTCWVFFIASLITLPELIINVYGPAMDEEATSSELQFFSTTIGNLGSFENATVAVPGCKEDQFHSYSCVYDKYDLGKFYVILDTAFCVFFVLAYRWLKSFEKREAKFLNRKTVSAAGFTIRVLSIPEDTREAELRHHFAVLTGQPVAEVNIGYNSGDLINIYKERGAIWKKRNKISNRIRYIRTEVKTHPLGENWSEYRRLGRHKRKWDKLTEKINKIDQKSRFTESGDRAISAYVTFETEEGVINALKAYKLSGFNKLCPPNALRIRGRLLRVTTAPDPSTILWENLEHSWCGRTTRKFIALCIGASALVLSLVVGVTARQYQKDAAEEAGEDVCPENFNDRSIWEMKELVDEDPEIYHCYCAELTEDEFDTDQKCVDIENAKRLATVLLFLAAGSTVFTNFLVEQVIRQTTAFEKHHSKDHMQNSVFHRVFFLKLLNLGMLPLLFNSYIVQNVITDNPVYSSDFDDNWYETVGSTIILNMLLNAFSPHGSKFGQLWLRNHKIDGILGSDDVTLTQDEMNEAFLGPEFHMALSYAQIIATISVCMLYSTGLPVLNIICFGSMFIFYWTDKIMFSRLYRTPPFFTEDLGRAATKVLGYAFFGHMAVGLWMLGNNGIFESDEADTPAFVERIRSHDDEKVITRIGQQHLLPLLMMFLILVAYFIINKVLHGTTHFTKRLVNILTCGSQGDLKRVVEELSDIQVTYTSAVNRRLMRGLTSYNILQNPVYKDLFAISDKFAKEHQHLRSIRNFDGDANDLVSMRSMRV